jgi:polyhydroxyalkanoate synthesis regulator phasin
MARGEAEKLISRLRKLSEQGAATFFNEVMASDRLRKRFGRAGERFMANKHSFDRNVESILDFVNIPSKRDVRDLKSRLDTLSSQIVNLSMKIDRMLAEETGHHEVRIGENSEAHPKRARKRPASR